MSRTEPATQLRALLEEGRREGIFPSAQAVVLHQGREVLSLHTGDVTPETLFDLASLTKVMCTGALAMRAWAEGKIGPDAPVARVLPESTSALMGATVGDLLYHRAGLPAFVPFFMPVLRAVPELRAIDCPPKVRLEVREEVVAAAKKAGPPTEQRTDENAGATAASAPTAAPRAVYSDVGFIVLGELLASLWNAPLDVVFEQQVARPLGLTSRFHRLSEWDDRWPSLTAPTGTRRPREAAPGQSGGWESLGWLDSRAGEVDDDNAWVMDGVAGHTGLFGTATDVARFGQAVLDEVDGAGRLAHPLLWKRALQRDTQTPGSTRALAFDTPSTGDELASASAGLAIASSPGGAVGHLGFTGTSLWIDLGRKLVVALCTNRTLLGRANLGIKAFRPRFHDAVVSALGLASSTETPHGG